MVTLNSQPPLLKCEYIAATFRLGSVQLLKEPKNHIAKRYAALWYYRYDRCHPARSRRLPHCVGDMEQTDVAKKELIEVLIKEQL